MGNSCSREGHCQYSNAPPLIVTNDQGIVVRVNLLFDLGCWDSGAGVVDKLPAELFQRGLNEVTLRRYLDELPEINRLRPTQFRTCMSCFSTTVFCPCLLGRWCRKEAKAVEKWDDALRDWQKRLNDRELNKIGHYVKTQSNSFSTYDRNGVYKMVSRWVAIALTPEESGKLKEEPHLMGDVEGGSCLGGPNEENCCLHP